MEFETVDNKVDNPTIILADAINQLAIAVETIAWNTLHSQVPFIGFDVIQRDLYKIREDIAKLLPE